MPDEMPIGQPPSQPHLRFQRSTPIHRPILHVSFGNLLEIAAAGLGCYAIYRLAGLSWALVAGAVMLLVAAELVYDVSVLHLPLPKRARPIAWAKTWRKRRKATRRPRKATASA